MPFLPGKPLEMSKSAGKLTLFQLWRHPTFPLDQQTLAEVFNLRNFGGPEVERATIIYGRWKRFMNDHA